MKVRRIILEEDYALLATWWTRRGTEAPHIKLLPEVGVMAFDEAGPTACAFLYVDRGNTIAMVEWEATNPCCTSPLRSIRALNMVFDFFEKFCTEEGIPIVLSWVAETRGDGRLLERRKWMKCVGDRHALMSFSTQTPEVLCQQ